MEILIIIVLVLCVGYLLVHIIGLLIALMGCFVYFVAIACAIWLIAMVLGVHTALVVVAIVVIVGFILSLLL